ncbi:DUF1870 family protein [Salmonella enterica]|nr:DUF1870 family protein [Salmonella enterica]
MNNLELQACRKMLFLDVVDAAKHIGGVEARTWRYYESGRSSIPERVLLKIDALLQRRADVLEQMRAEAVEYRKKGDGRLVTPYHPTFEQFEQDTGVPDQLEWHIDMSVKSALYLEDMVTFY